MVRLDQTEIYNVFGCIGVLLIVTGTLWCCFYLFRGFYETAQNPPPPPPETREGETDEPDQQQQQQLTTEGQKAVVTPTRSTAPEAASENDSNYRFNDEVYIRWDLIPATAWVVTLGMRVVNPPAARVNKHQKSSEPLLVSQPESDGLVLSLEDRGKYQFQTSQPYTQMQFTRDPSNYNPAVERLLLRFTRVLEGRTKVEALVNGRLIDNQTYLESATLLDEMRLWPQKLMIKNKNKMRNIWMTYE